MEWINEISNMDNVIYNICIKNECLVINIKLWNGKHKKIEFTNYYLKLPTPLQGIKP